MQNKLNEIRNLFEHANNQTCLLKIIEEIQLLSHPDYQQHVDWNELKQLYNRSIKTIPTLCNKIKNMIEDNMKNKSPKVDNNDLILQEIRLIRNEFHGEIKLIRNEISDLRNEFHGEIKLIRNEISDLRNEFHGEIKLIRNEISDLRNEFHGEIKSLKSEFNGKFDILNKEIKEIRDDVTRGFKNLENHFGIDFLNKKNQ